VSRGYPQLVQPLREAMIDPTKIMRRFIMLTVTDNALTEIRNLTEGQDTPEDRGLRIAADPGAGSLTVPSENDTVVDADGVRLFLDTAATDLLDDKTLDAVRDPESGQLQFAVTDQPPA
jgi:Fe-S cluster assembly iron-binding protein IscA